MGTFFSTNDIRGRVDDELTTEYVWNIGKGLADWLPEKGSVVIVRSADANDTTVHALTEGILLQGRDVIDAGQGDQQAAVMAVGEHEAAGAALIAHDLVENSEIITLFDARGVVITADSGLSEISELVESGNFIPAPEKGTLRISNVRL